MPPRRRSGARPPPPPPPRHGGEGGPPGPPGRQSGSLAPGSRADGPLRPRAQARKLREQAKGAAAAVAGRGRQGSGNWNKSTYAPHPRREEFHSSLPGPSRPAELSPTWKNTQAKHRNYMKVSAQRAAEQKKNGEPSQLRGARRDRTGSRRAPRDGGRVRVRGLTPSAREADDEHALRQVGALGRVEPHDAGRPEAQGAADGGADGQGAADPGAVHNDAVSPRPGRNASESFRRNPRRRRRELRRKLSALDPSVY